MRSGRFLLPLLLALSCCSSPAFAWGPSIGMIGFGAAAGGGAPTYLASESFDTDPGYDLTWVEVTGDPNPDYATSPAPLAGTQSLYYNACATDNTDREAYTAYTIGAGVQSEAYFKVRFTAVNAITGSRVLARFATTTSARAIFSLTRSGVNNLLTTQAFGGTAVNTVGTLVANTTYHVWITYLKGTGANAVATVAFSTDGVRPTSGNNYAESTNGNVTADANRLYLGGDNFSAQPTNCYDAIIDDVRIDDVAIGDNPQ